MFVYSVCLAMCVGLCVCVVRFVCAVYVCLSACVFCVCECAVLLSV